MSMSFKSEAFRADNPTPEPVRQPIPDPASPQPNPTTSLLEDAGTLTREYRATVRTWLELVALETRLAARTVVHMVALGIGMAVLAVGAYLSLIGAGVLALINQGLSPTLAMLVASGINILAAAVLFFSLRKKARSIGWPATSRALNTDADPAASKES